MLTEQKGKRNRLLKRGILFVFLPCIVAGIYLYLHLQSSLPPLEGEFRVDGITHTVSIVRDERGIPTVLAQNDRDAYFSMGYLHAQDRLWQLEFQRRLAYGELSEVFGYKLLEQDRWMRTLGLKYSAQSAWQGLSPQAQESLLAYSAGINAWIEQQTSLPPEFQVLTITPRPWTPIDSLAWNKFFALSLAKNVRTEIDYYLARQTLSEKQLTSLFNQPNDTEQLASSESVAHAMLGLNQIQARLENEFAVGNKNIGSNAWVVSGKITSTQTPLLANDPHLGIQIPSLWYAANIQGDKLQVSGMTLVGLPLIIFGHNADIAWGGTNLMADVQDLYYEQINPDDSNQYLTEDGWKNFETRQEIIKVRAEKPALLRPLLKPIKHNVRVTQTGPIVSDLFGVFEQPISLSWIALKGQDTSYEALYQTSYATDWQSFSTALSAYVAPALNFLYADNAGNIGHLVAGRLPVRGKGEGMTILPAWKQEYQWLGEVRYKDMPKTLNPESGYLYQANNAVESDFFISHDFASPTRSHRIEQLIQQKLASSGNITPSDMAEMQTDVTDLAAQQLVSILTAIQPENARQAEVMNRLVGWQGEMSTSSQAAAIFHVWMRHFRQQLIQRNLSEQWGTPAQQLQLNALSGYINLDAIPSILANDHDWCNNRTDGFQSINRCHILLLQTLDSAIEELDKFFGTNVDNWHWGELQSEFYRHNPFSEIKLMNVFFERKHSTGGSPNTLNVATAQFDKTEGYRKTFGAGFRFVIDLNQESVTLNFVNAIGQSGHFLSEHYDDMLEAFHQGKLFPIRDKAALDSELVLQPKIVNNKK